MGDEPLGAIGYAKRRNRLHNHRTRTQSPSKTLSGICTAGCSPCKSNYLTRATILIFSESVRARAPDLARSGPSQLFLLYDVFHMQVTEGNLTQTIADNITCISHIQIADVPGRHEPGTGEINFAHLFRQLMRWGSRAGLAASTIH